MPIVASQLIAKVAAEGATETERSLESVGRKSDETKGHFDLLKGALSFAAGQFLFNAMSTGLGFLKDQLVDTVKVALGHQQIQAQTAQALKSTHDASGETAQAISDLADKFSNLTSYSADTTQSAENLLLTFTNIGKDIFPDTTKAVLDVSQAMHEDLKSASIEVGKAMGDPLTGMTALQRIGVTFSSTQKDLIKNYMAHGETAKAQKVILQELQKEFGDSAEAAGKTLGGQLDILKNKFEDIKVKIGGALLPVLGDMLNKYIFPLALKFSDWLTKGGGLQDFQNLVTKIANFFTSDFLPAMNDLLNKYVIPLATNMYDLFIKSGFLQGVWDDITGILTDMAPYLSGFVQDIISFLQWANQGGPWVTALGVAIGGVALAVAGFKLAGWLQEVNNNIGNVLTNIGKMKGNFSDFITWFGDTFLSKFKSTTTEAATSTEGIGTAAQTAETEVAAASGEMDAEIGGVGVSADTASAATKGIGVGLLGSLATIMSTISLIGGVALIEFEIAKFLKDNHILPDAPKAGVPGWITHQRPPGMASGGIVAQGGIVDVGEQGRERVFLPTGAQVIPHNMLGSTQPNITVQAPDVYLDGYLLTRGMMPYIANAVRYGTGSVGI